MRTVRPLPPGEATSLLEVCRGARITLPAELQEALDVREGDYLEAELVEGGVMLRPVSIVGHERA